MENKKMFRLFGKTLDVARTVVHYLVYGILILRKAKLIRPAGHFITSRSFMQGLLLSIPGPTLIDLKQSVGTDSHGISFIFTARSIGFLIGSLTGGIVLDSMKNEELALIISSAFVAAGAYAIPWCRNLPMLIGTFMLTGFAIGFSNTGCNASCLRIWGKKGAPFLQGLHFSYGVGGFLAPVLAAPFLSTHEPAIQSDFSLLGISQNLTELDSITPMSILPNTSDIEVLIKAGESTIPTITYAYTIVGIAGTIICGCFIFVHMLAAPEKGALSTTEQNNMHAPGLSFTIIVVILACLQTGLISGVEVSFAQMLTSYVVKSDHKLTKVTGSYMTSVYWGAFTLTRGVSILLAYKVSVMRLLAFDLILSVTATLVLLTIGTWSVTALWIGTAFLGISVASIFPATLSWIEKYININNRIASIFTLVSCILEMTVPLTVSIYLDTHTNVLFHFMTAATLSCCVLFIALNIILNRKGEKYEPTSENIKEQDEQLQLNAL